MNRQSLAKRMLNRTLRRAQESAMISSLEEGEVFVCRLCETPEKPCVENPLAECPEKILGGTELQIVRGRTRALVHEEPFRCLGCGRSLSVTALSHDPLTELCPSCRGRVRKLKRKYSSVRIRP